MLAASFFSSCRQQRQAPSLPSFLHPNPACHRRSRSHHPPRIASHRIPCPNAYLRYLPKHSRSAHHIRPRPRLYLRSVPPPHLAPSPLISGESFILVRFPAEQAQVLALPLDTVCRPAAASCSACNHESIYSMPSSPILPARVACPEPKPWLVGIEFPFLLPYAADLKPSLGQLLPHLASCCFLFFFLTIHRVYFGSTNCRRTRLPANGINLS